MNIDKDLSQMKIKPLTKEETERVWQYIVTTIHQPASASRFSIIDIIRKPFMWMAIVAFVLFGGSVATAYASDNAKPGDLLFSIDRAIEEIQLKLASSQQRTELKLSMVQERLDEIQEILAESDTGEEPAESPEGIQAGPPPATTSTDVGGGGEQDGEDGEDGEDGDDEDDGDEEDEDEQEQGNEQVNASGDFGDKERVEQAFATALDFIASIREGLLADGNLEAVAALDAIVAEMDTEIDELPSKWKFDIKKNRDKYRLTLDIRSSDGKQKLKIKTNNGKIDIDYKDNDGKSKLKVKKDGDVKFRSKDKGRKDDEDVTHPVVATFSPADDSTDVAPDTNLVITFSENVVAGAGNITIKKASDDSVVEMFDVASVSGLGSDTITIDPTTDLDGETDYYVQIDATAFEDEAGNTYAGIADTTTWNFSTADTTAPVTSSISPDDDATDVAIGTNLVITFSENVVAGAGNITIKKANDDSVVEAIDVTSVAGLGTDTITIDLTSDLESDTNYYVQIDSGALEDTAGNEYAGIADTTTWNFTTIAAP